MSRSRGGEPPRQTKLARTTAFDPLAVERSFESTSAPPIGPSSVISDKTGTQPPLLAVWREPDGDRLSPTSPVRMLRKTQAARRTNRPWGAIRCQGPRWWSWPPNSSSIPLRSWNGRSFIPAFFPQGIFLKTIRHTSWRTIKFRTPCLQLSP